jgi:hypothetical protein
LATRKVKCASILLIFLLSGIGILILSVPTLPVASAALSTSPWQITQEWLNRQLVAWKPAQNSTIGFSAFYPSVSYANVNTVSTADKLADLSMLQSSGASCIRIDLNYPVLSGIPLTGNCLIIADAGSQSYYNNPLPWSQFKAAWVQRVAAIAWQFHPQFYIVVKEPGWYAPMVSDAGTNPLFASSSDWLALTQSLVNAVQAVSPNTKIGVSIDASDRGVHGSFFVPYLQGVKQMQGIGLIGFDIYNIPGFTNTEAFLTQYGAGGKNVWMAEAWSGSASIVFDSSRAQLDKSWMLASYYFAQHVHATNIMPYFTNIFASYSQTVDYSQRTPVFYEFQSLAASYGTRLGPLTLPQTQRLF